MHTSEWAYDHLFSVQIPSVCYQVSHLPPSDPLLPSPTLGRRWEDSTPFTCWLVRFSKEEPQQNGWWACDPAIYLFTWLPPARLLCCLCPFTDRHSSSPDTVGNICSFWVPGPFLPSLCPFGTGSGNSSSAHTFLKCLCKSNLLELSCHLFPGESLTAFLLYGS